MTPIQKALDAIRERQSKSMERLADMIISHEMSHAPFCDGSYWREEFDRLIQDNSPEGGDVSRLIAACEVMANALTDIQNDHEKAKYYTQNNARIYVKVREALAKATAILEEKL